MVLHIILTFLPFFALSRFKLFRREENFPENLIVWTVLVGIVLLLIEYHREKEYKNDSSVGTKLALHTPIIRKFRFYADNKFVVAISPDDNDHQLYLSIREEDYALLKEGETLILRYAEKSRLIFSLHSSHGRELQFVHQPHGFYLPEFKANKSSEVSSSQ